MGQTSIVWCEKCQKLSPNSSAPYSSMERFSIFQPFVLVHSYHSQQPCFQLQQAAIQRESLDKSAQN